MVTAIRTEKVSAAKASAGALSLKKEFLKFFYMAPRFLRFHVEKYVMIFLIHEYSSSFSSKTGAAGGKELTINLRA